MHSWDLQSFSQPRFKLLAGGRLEEFWEWETESEIRILGELAVHQGSCYKDGLLDGERYHGCGSKCFHLARDGLFQQPVSGYLPCCAELPVIGGGLINLSKLSCYALVVSPFTQVLPTLRNG